MMPLLSRIEDAAGHPPARRLRPFAFFLLALAAGGWVLPGSAQADPPAPKAQPGTTAVAPADTVVAHRVLAYYFHTTRRCTSCRKIEAYTSEAITSGFAAELDDGRLVFQAVNIEEEPNEHFIDDYKLFTKSVVLVDERSGEQAAWKNLPRVWELLGDKEAFIRYIQGETREYLSGKKS
jgi:hypothetical protein